MNISFFFYDGLLAGYASAAKQDDAKYKGYANNAMLNSILDGFLGP
jgi:hypothetical protein